MGSIYDPNFSIATMPWEVTFRAPTLIAFTLALYFVILQGNLFAGYIGLVYLDGLCYVLNLRLKECSNIGVRQKLLLDMSHASRIKHLDHRKCTNGVAQSQPSPSSVFETLLFQVLL